MRTSGIKRLANDPETCLRKVRYDTWEAARAAGLAVSQENPRAADANAPTPYPCSLNGEQHYHVGHIRFGSDA